MAAHADLEAVKSRQRAAWAAGNYSLVGTTLQIVGESLCEAIDLRAGSLVLDVAAGNGNATLAAARRWCDVVSTDYVAAVLESGRLRARAEEQIVKFQEADAERLPFADETFDVVVSTFGVMFAPDQERAAGELVRVCKPRGTIGLANWTPESVIGRVLALIDEHAPHAASVVLATSWGTRARLDELFGETTHRIGVQRREFVFRYRSPMHWIEVFRTYYGPLTAAFGALAPDAQAALTRELLDLLEERNRSRDRSLVLPSEYLEVEIRMR